jgi:hypothetical protein
MARIKDVFDPILANHKMYQALYERVYTKVYDRLLPLYKEIQEITGYPE